MNVFMWTIEDSLDGIGILIYSFSGVVFRFPPYLWILFLEFQLYW